MISSRIAILHGTILLGLVMAGVSCKKQDWKGVYTGTEELVIISSTDTIMSSFQQAVVIDFKGGKCHFDSQTLIWEFKNNQKNEEGYTFDSGGTFFDIRFKGDSLLASYQTTELNQLTSRIFRGKK